MMQTKTLLSMTLILLLLSPVHLAAQNKSTFSADKTIRIEDLIHTVISENKIPGLSVAVIGDNQLRYANGFGTADLENSSPAKPGTVYRLGSLSKTITATVVMR